MKQVIVLCDKDFYNNRYLFFSVVRIYDKIKPSPTGVVLSYFP